MNVQGLGTATWRVEGRIPVQIDYPLIEDVIGEEAAAPIYAHWDRAWGEVVDFGADTYGITVEMMESVEAEPLAAAIGCDLELARQILSECHRVFKQQPYS